MTKVKYVARPLPELADLLGESDEEVSRIRRALLDQLMLVVREKVEGMSKTAAADWLASLIMDHSYPMTNDQIARWIGSIANWQVGG